MPKFTLLSRVYLGDEELFELLKNLPRRELLRMARRRGYLFGEKEEEDVIRNFFAMLPSDWRFVTGSLALFSKPSKQERKMSVDVKGCEPSLSVDNIVQASAEQRSGKFSEVYNPVRVDDKTYKLEVTYVDVDYSRALVYQREEKKLTIEMTQEGNGISFMYNANDRALEIVNDLKSRLKFQANVTPEIVTVSLKAIREPAIRTKFFTQLIKSVEGFNFLNATHLTVDRRLPALDDMSLQSSPEPEDEEEKPEVTKKDKQAEKIKSLVNSVSLKGEQVMADKLYQLAESSGYYISNIAWSCTDTKDVRKGMDCVAGFKDPVEADEFTFEVVRKWKYNNEDPDDEDPIALNESEKRALNRLLLAAALKSLDTINKPVKKSQVKPSPSTDADSVSNPP
jgi:hypothetical protein